jgi:hypothetical protein
VIPRFSVRRLATPALALLALCATGPVASESVEPLLRRRAEAFVAAMNAPDRAALEAFARDHLESRVAREGLAPRFVDRMLATREELGPIERHSVQVLRGGALVFVYCKHAKGGAWQNYQFRVLAADEQRLQLVFRAVAIEPLERPDLPLASAQAAEWLTRFEASLDQQQPFSGIAVVRSGGKEIYSRVQGVADAVSRSTRRSHATCRTSPTASSPGARRSTSS